MRIFAFVKNVVVGVAQAALHGHTPTTAHLAVDKVMRAFEKAEQKRSDVMDAITAAQQARIATLAAIHADMAAFEAIKKLLP